MKSNIVTPIIAIVVALIVIGGGAYWYFQNDDLVDINILSINKSEEVATSIAATLAYQKGEVSIKVDDGDWLSVETDTVLHQGDSVKTGTDSAVKAIIELENGDVIRLGYNTEIFLTSLKSNSIIITQVSGASYHRVAKDRTNTYEVVAANVTAQALGTAFDVVIGEENIEVGVVESKVKVVTGNDSKEVTEGESALYDIEDKNVDVSDIGEDELTNEWYTWNKEEDSKNTDKLGVLADYAGPELKIITPADAEVTSNDKIIIEGTVSDFDATLTINDEAVDNEAGQYSYELSLIVGKNIITVVAEDANGYRTIKEIKVIYQTAPAQATPITLSAETKTDGVYLNWNIASGLGLKYYKVVRSETNSDLKYPDNGYIAVNSKGRENYTDTDVSIDNTYYYRVCEVYEGDNIFCSNVVNMKGKTAAVEVEEEEVEEDRIGIFLLAEAKSDGVHMSWSVEGVEITNGFKLVRSESENPVYPGDDYKYLSDSSKHSYTWAATKGKTYHYRVCQYTTEGTCLIYSNDLSVKSYNAEDASEDEDTETSVTVTMSATAESSGVGLWWNNVAEDISGFKYYKVVRSETNADLRYPDDSYIAVKNKGDESYRDYASRSTKSYYYRICAVGDQIHCSNVIKVTPIHVNAAPAALILSGSYADGSMTLSWNQSNEVDFSYYKVVWDQENATPKYPADGYIRAIGDRTTVTHLDEGDKSSTRSADADLNIGTHYYTVCIVDSQSQVACSNTVTLVDGDIQVIQ
ncbi:MAG: FecR domain-containing protein [Candidatus Kerfeldbacteria bacterium]